MHRFRKLSTRLAGRQHSSASSVTGQGRSSFDSVQTTSLPPAYDLLYSCGNITSPKSSKGKEASGNNQKIHLNECDIVDPSFVDDLYGAACGGEKALEKCLMSGRHIDTKDQTEETAFVRAVLRRDYAAAELLLSRGANIDSRGNYKRTALYRAASEGSEEVTRWLLAHGAEVNAQDQSLATPLEASITSFSDTKTWVSLLLINHGADVRNTSKDEGAIHTAARRGTTEQIELLIKHGADVTIKSVDGLTPLHLAAQWHRSHVYNIFLAMGVPVDIRSGPFTTYLRKFYDFPENSTPLHLAAADLETVRALLDAGADPNARDSRGRIPLFNTFIYKFGFKDAREPIVQLFISHGAYIDAIDSSHIPILYAACHQPNTEAIELLLEHGANPEFLTIPSNKYEFDLPKGLPETPLEYAITHIDDTFRIKLLLGLNCAVDNQNRDTGITPLHAAVMIPTTITSPGGHRRHQKRNPEEKLRLLLAAGADVEKRDSQRGYTPLMLAAENGDVGHINLLVQEGRANVNAVGSDGKTTAVVVARQKGMEKAVRLLEELGAVSQELEDGRETHEGETHEGEKHEEEKHEEEKHGEEKHGEEKLEEEKHEEEKNEEEKHEGAKQDEDKHEEKKH